jgi:hypothetical protein
LDLSGRLAKKIDQIGIGLVASRNNKIGSRFRSNFSDSCLKLLKPEQDDRKTIFELFVLKHIKIYSFSKIINMNLPVETTLLEEDFFSLKIQIMV